MPSVMPSIISAESTKMPSVKSTRMPSAKSEDRRLNSLKYEDTK